MCTIFVCLVHRLKRLGSRFSHSATQTDEPDTSSNAPGRVPRTSDGRPIISAPVPGTFENRIDAGILRREVEAEKSRANDDPHVPRRRQTEMPLACHPPMRQSWLEIQHVGSRLESVTVTGSKTPSTSTSANPDTAELLTNSSHQFISNTLATPASSVTHNSRNISNGEPRPADKDHGMTSHAHSPTAFHHTRQQKPSTSTSTLKHPPQNQLNPRTSYRRDIYQAPPPAPRTPAAHRHSSLALHADSRLQAEIFSKVGIEINEVMKAFASGMLSQTCRPSRW